jgi:hypothetical protein
VAGANAEDLTGFLRGQFSQQSQCDDLALPPRQCTDRLADFRRQRFEARRLLGRGSIRWRDEQFPPQSPPPERQTLRAVSTTQAVGLG